MLGFQHDSCQDIARIRSPEGVSESGSNIENSWVAVVCVVHLACLFSQRTGGVYSLSLLVV